MNYLIEKYIKPNFNSNYLINFLDDDKFLNLNRKEIKFRISQLTVIQSLEVLNNNIRPIYSENPEWNGMKLSRENLSMFFDFIDFGEISQTIECISEMGFNCNNYFFLEELENKHSKEDIISFENEFQNQYFSLSKKLVEALKFKLNYLNKKELEYFSNAFFPKSEDFQKEFGRISIVEFLIKHLDFSLNNVSTGNLLRNYNKGSNSYKVKTKELVLKKLYDQLEINEFIKMSKTSFQDFIDVLKKNWNSHKAIIYLEMDHYQTKLFLDELKKTLKIKLQYSTVEKAENIANNKGLIKANILSASATNSRVAFRLKDKIEEDNQIIEIINKVKI